MVLSFGAAWPASILKSYKTRTTQGKSLFFLCIVEFGYLCGIAAKLTSGNITYVVFFYILNALMVLADILLYFRNRMRERSLPAGLKTERMRV